jgi:hypothetical protein
MIREAEEPPVDDEPKDDDDGSDLFFIVSLIIMIMVIIVMLLILFIVLRKHRKGEKIFGKEEEVKKDGELQRPGEEGIITPKPGEIKPSGEAGVIKSPTQYVPPSQGIPQTLPETPSDQLSSQQSQSSMQTQTPQIPAGTAQMPPPQMTNCPKCNSMMTFGPDGKLFCMICGYSNENTN